MKTPGFDFKRFIELADLFMQTEFAKELEEAQDYAYELFVDEVEDLKSCEGNYDEDGYEFDDVAECVQRLIYQDETQLIPKPFADVACLVYDEAVSRHDAEMTNNYGTLFYSGRMGTVDYDKAAYYYNLASDWGCDLATENLGYIYYYGRTGEIDYAKAFMMFAKGAVFNRPISIYKLGDMYRNGFYVSKSVETAFKLYKKAESFLDEVDESESSNPSPDVFFRLGKCYYYGQGTDANLREAFKYFQQAERGFIEKIAQGDFFVKAMLEETIALEEKVRKELLVGLPQMEWAGK